MGCTQASESCKEALTPLQRHLQSAAPCQLQLVRTCAAARGGTSTRQASPHTQMQRLNMRAPARRADGQRRA